MTISATTRLAFLPFAAPSGPFPDGIWTSQQTVIGDASGGEMVIVHEVLLLTEPFSALMLTLEQFTLDDNANAADQVVLEILGFEEHNPIGNNNLIMAFQTLTTDITVDAFGPAGMLQRPLFLGRADRTSGQPTQLSVRMNNRDGIALRDALYGYYWTPGAMNVPGGPQRPPGSLFGG